MPVPVPTADEWSTLSADEKRARLLAAAGEVFVRDGVDAPMPAIAAAAGAGVGSVYRQFASKRDLLAELVVGRLDEVVARIDEATARRGDRWSALTDVLLALAERQAADDILGEAMAAVSEHPAVVLAGARATAALDALLVAARAEGGLRADATTLDVRLLFVAMRAAEQAERGSWRRVLQLFVDALAASPH